MLFAGNMVRQPAMDGVKYKMYDLKNTDKVMNDGFWIGVYPGLTDDMLNYIVEQFESFTIGKKRLTDASPN